MTRLVATYRLPVSLLLDSDCFGREYAVRIAGVDLRLHTPRVVPVGGRWDVQKPDIAGVPEPPDDDFAWGSVTGWRTDPPTVEAAWVSGIALDMDLSDDSLEREVINPNGAWQPAGATVDKLFAGIGGWSDAVFAWVGSLVNQHTFSGDRLQGAGWVGDGLTVRAVDGDGESPRDMRSNNMMVTIRVSTSVERPTFEWVLNAVDHNQEPPLAHKFLREAAGEYRRGQLRRAVIEAGSAAELALSRWHAANPSGWKKELNGDVTLGAAVKFTKAPFPADAATALVGVRNDAIHRAQTPSSEQVIRAIEIAAEIVEACEPLGAPQSPLDAARDLRHRSPWEANRHT